MATSNQIAIKEARERERSNKKNEDLKSRELTEKEKMGKNQRGVNIANAITQPITGILGAAAKAFNDPAWYNTDPQLLKDVAQISFNNPLGGAFKTNLSNTKTTVPGIWAISFMPTIGKCTVDGRASTADIAAKSIYSYVRYANSGARNYEASDLMMYLLAVTEGYSYYSFMTRLYSLITTSKAHNRYYINAMCSACGVDPDDLRSNIANFRAYINSYAVRLNSLYIPKDLPYMMRHVWMNGTIFKDQPIKKSQEYMFVQPMFLVYDDINGKLTPYIDGNIPDSDNQDVPFVMGSANKFNQIKWRGDYIINQLVSSEDAGIMGGDILKAYGESNMAYAASIKEDYHIESQYSLEVLSQIHNAMHSQIGGVHSDWKTNKDVFNVEQISDPNTLVSYLKQGEAFYESNDSANPIGYGFKTTLGSNAYEVGTENSVLNFYKDEPTPDDVMVATRLQFVAQPNVYFGTSGSRNKLKAVISTGSEIVLTSNIITINPETYESTGYEVAGMFLNLSTVKDVVNVLSLIAQFDWHPRLFVSNSNNPDIKFFINNGFGDMANYTTLADQVKDNLNYVALLSEFGIPRLGLTVRTR